MSTFTSQITTARKALWSAVNDYSETKEFFNTKIRLDDVDSRGTAMRDPVPSISDLPAILIETQSIKPKWFVSQLKEWPIMVGVKIWTKDWNYTTAEEACERFFNATWRAAASGETVGIVKNATGRHPQFNTMTFRRVVLKQSESDQGFKAIEGSIVVALSTYKGPFADGAC